MIISSRPKFVVNREEDVDLVGSWVLNADNSRRYELLRAFGGKRVFRYTTGMSDPRSLIVKTWSTQKYGADTSFRRRIFGVRNGCANEFRIAKRVELYAPRLRAPHVYGRIPGVHILGELCDVALHQDLGPCVTGTDFLKTCIRDGKVERFAEAEDYIIDSVCELLFAANIIDDDHSIINIVHSLDSQHLHRIDFEVAKLWSECWAPQHAIGGMLGRILATFTFACQPDMNLVDHFAEKLISEVGHDRLTKYAWQRSLRVVRRALLRQREQIGIDSRPTLERLGEISGVRGSS